MDVKALARSKRGHTQQHNRRYQGSHHGGNKVKASGSNDAAKEPLIEKKKTRPQGSPALPTNWDRYEEEVLDSGSEGISPESSSKTLDVVVPKSKGADFRHLVAEAQSHAEKTLEGFSSLDDLLPWEFGVGLSSMLAIRGEGMLSWVGDENFVVQDDNTSANQEASIISLNLNAIAEKLAKVDLSKRLFLEPDLLPTELCVENLALGTDEEPDELETTEDSELANRMSKELNLDDFAADQFTSSSSCSSNTAAAFTLSNDFPIPVYNVNVEFQQVGSSGKNKTFLPSAEANLHPIGDTIGKHSTFEASAAEEELDMLLDSLGETKILDSPGLNSSTSFPVSLGVSSMDLPDVSNKEPVPSKIASIAPSLDDALDDLLEETSTLMNPNALLRPQEEKPVHNNIQPSHSGSKSKVSDDFESWFDTL